ncbi:UDP-N-acetylglucosamine 2-epimerase (non-hydrolyzing) [bacterium]|nr:UDP-N-acetylglucosamine 2-epimerase (non-hydrolyzing) [bacterium]
MNVLFVVGTRPEAIKMAPIILQLRKAYGFQSAKLVSTGQHREMLTQTLSIFGLKPDLDLDIMQPDQSLSELTSRLILKLDAALSREKPDWVLAQGDTTSVLAAALVSFYQKRCFGHVEAGLRTGDYLNPFPEEMNRRIADLAASAYFAPTQRAAQALLKEGIAESKIHVTGNTVIDSLQWMVASGKLPDPRAKLRLPKNSELVLITAHRRESFGPQFKDICLAILQLAEKHPKIQFVYPVHLNPHVQKPVKEILGSQPNVRLVEPLDYASLTALMQKSRMILTDSGGIQEEAPTFGVPVLVMRKTTERPEGVESGAVRLVGTEQASILQAGDELLSKPLVRWRGANPYGDGDAARRIVQIVMQEKQTA